MIGLINIDEIKKHLEYFIKETDAKNIKNKLLSLECNE